MLLISLQAKKDPKYQQILERETAIVAVAYKHIEDCSKKERDYGGSKNKDTEDIFSTQSEHLGSITTDSK
jgi:hypothetical protein